MPLLTWQLWLAKDVVTEIRLPWQKSLPELTPGRVVQSMVKHYRIFSAINQLGLWFGNCWCRSKSLYSDNGERSPRVGCS